MSQFDDKVNSRADLTPNKSSSLQEAFEVTSPLENQSISRRTQEITNFVAVTDSNEGSQSSSPQKSFKIKDAIADTTALILFSTPLAMGIDMLSAGATLNQALIARLIALPINLVTSRPYGKFRDWCFEKLKMNKETPLWKRTIVDSLALVAFQGPLYAGILTTSGYLSGNPFTPTSVAAAVASVIPVMLIIGRPYGWFRNHVRAKLFRLQNQD